MSIIYGEVKLKKKDGETAIALYLIEYRTECAAGFTLVDQRYIDNLLCVLLLICIQKRTQKTSMYTKHIVQFNGALPISSVVVVLMNVERKVLHV